MKTSFLGLCFVAVLFCVSPASAQVSVYFEAPVITMNVGETRTIHAFVDIGSSSLVNQWGFNVDPSSDTVAILLSENVDPIWTDIGAFAGYSAQGITGLGTPLGSFDFLASYPGTMTLGLYYPTEPWQGQGVPSYFDPIFVTVNVVPAPSTGLLALGGFAFLGRRRRR